MFADYFPLILGPLSSTHALEDTAKFSLCAKIKETFLRLTVLL